MVALSLVLALITVPFMPVEAHAAVPMVSTPISDKADLSGPFAAFGSHVVFGTHRSSDGGATWVVDASLSSVASTGAWRNTTTDGRLVGYTQSSSTFTAVVYSASSGTAQTFPLVSSPTRMSTSWALSNTATGVSAYNFVTGGPSVTVSPPTGALADSPIADLSPLGAVIWSATSADAHHVVAVAASPTAAPSAWTTIDNVLTTVITDTQLTYVVNLTDRLQVCSRSLASVTSAPTCTTVLVVVPSPQIRLFHFGSTFIVTTPVYDPNLTARRTELWTGSAWVEVQVNRYDTDIALPYAAGNPIGTGGTTGTYGDTPYVLMYDNDSVPSMQRVAASGAVSNGFPFPRGGTASVSSLAVTADRVVGMDTRTASTGRLPAWSRPVSGSGFGNETQLLAAGEHLAASAGRTLIRGAGDWEIFDRGVWKQRINTYDFNAMSGPYVSQYLATASGVVTVVMTVAGEVVATLPSTMGAGVLFGSRAVTSAAPSGAAGPMRLTVTDLTNQTATTSVDLPSGTGGCYVDSMWGDAVAVRCPTGVSTYNISTGAKIGTPLVSSTWPMKALLGDGYVIVSTGSGTYSILSYAGASLGDLSTCRPGTLAHDGAGHVVCSTATDIVWRDFSAAATSPGRVLAWTAPAATTSAWTPEVDVSKAFGAGVLRIRRGSTVVRDVPVPAAADGSLRGVAWDLNTAAGTMAPADTYTAELVVPSADGTGTVKAVDGVSAPTFTVKLVGGRSFVPISPYRVADTRSGWGVNPGGGIIWNGSVDVQITGRGGVPSSGVSSVLLNVTAIGNSWPQTSGYLTVYPSGTAQPLASNINFSTSQVVPNLVLAKLGANGMVTIANHSSMWTQAVVDVAGYFLDGVANDPGSVTGLAPARLLDTRVESGAVPANGSVVVRAAGRGGVPAAGVSAVVVNITAVTPKGAGFLTAYPTGTTAPNASNVNFSPGQIVATLAFVKLGADGTFTVRNGSPGATQVVVDVQGYVLSGNVIGSGMYVPLNPARVMDTRPDYGGIGPVAPSSSRSLTLAGAGGVPTSGVAAVVMNVTVVASAAGYLTAYPADATAVPTASNLNFIAGQVVPNLVAVKTSSAGAVALYNGSAGSTNVIVDVAGYFTA